MKVSQILKNEEYDLRVNFQEFKRTYKSVTARLGKLDFRSNITSLEIPKNYWIIQSSSCQVVIQLVNGIEISCMDLLFYKNRNRVLILL